MTSLPTDLDAPREAAGSPYPRIDALRRTSLGMLAVLLVEYGLGIGTNIFVTVPAADNGVSVGEGFGKAMSNGPGGLAAHAGLGVLLFVGATLVAVQALRSGRWSVAAASVVGWICIVGAAFSGAAFVGNGQNSSSMTMAVLTGVALFCYGLNLYVLGARRS